jgi:hypothetical protein
VKRPSFDELRAQLGGIVYKSPHQGLIYVHRLSFPISKPAESAVSTAAKGLRSIVASISEPTPRSRFCASAALSESLLSVLIRLNSKVAVPVGRRVGAAPVWKGDRHRLCGERCEGAIEDSRRELAPWIDAVGRKGGRRGSVSRRLRSAIRCGSWRSVSECGYLTRSVSVTDAGLRLLERLRPARSLGGEERHQQTTRLRNSGSSPPYYHDPRPCEAYEL